MDKDFMTSDFLLQTETARELYHEHAEGLPIIDYHCHLDPREVAEDHRFRSITELWLGGDHYKWRALRSNGVDEYFITGKASDWEKFEKWAETMPYLFRNPLYHWTHLELRTAFGINEQLNPETARLIYDRCNELLQQPEFSARGLMRRYRVEVVCTTDDPADSLEYHRAMRESPFETRVLPTWRPDKAMAIDNPETYRRYIQSLAQAADTDITTFDDLLRALHLRHDFFAQHGCRLSDHGLTRFFAEPYTDAQVHQAFDRVMAGHSLSEEEANRFRSAMLYEFGVMDAEKGWTQQFHYGAMRNNNSRMFSLLGPDTGYDSIGDVGGALQMSRFLDRLASEGHLPNTILYNLNPADNEVVASMLGNFQEGPQPGKIQFGSGWWFLDQKDGIERQINTLSLLGLLSRFVGMLTDSRSFLSYPRHEYFRRILCNLLGNDVEQGLLPYDGYERERLGQMVEDISYRNALRFFNF